jgi:acylphosphatase
MKPRAHIDEKHCASSPNLALSGVVGRANGAKPVVSQCPGDAGLGRAADMKSNRIRICYSGHVQGVGFRYAVKSIVAGFEVTGVVRNLPDGRVELVAEGQSQELDAFREAIRDSGLKHFIRDEQISWAEAAGEFRGFEIVR